MNIGGVNGESALPIVIYVHVIGMLRPRVGNEKLNQAEPDMNMSFIDPESEGGTAYRDFDRSTI